MTKRASNYYVYLLNRSTTRRFALHGCGSHQDGWGSLFARLFTSTGISTSFQCTTLSNTNEHLPSAEDNGKSLGIATPGTPMDSRPPVVRVWPIEILLPRFSEHVQVPVFSCLMDRMHWVSCQRHVYLFQVVHLSIVFVAQL